MCIQSNLQAQSRCDLCINRVRQVYLRRRG
ncbi:BnaC02g29930D [Brassica napus]|uniref:BnaC02g29930D protein n=1 Tax=Brassica napus TaxID=3708 RepID=A0A078FIH8_BRANA|nr:BnaC02g29930D [Brassica napus]